MFFFVLSGYLITTVLIADRANPGVLARFYERRIRRLGSAMAVVFLASTVVAWWLLPTAPMRDYAHSLIAAAVSGANLLFWRGSGYFDLTVDERPLLPVS